MNWIKSDGIISRMNIDLAFLNLFDFLPVITSEKTKDFSLFISFKKSFIFIFYILFSIFIKIICKETDQFYNYKSFT